MTLLADAAPQGGVVEGACASCGRIKRLTLSCEVRTVRVADQRYPAVPFGSETRWRTQPGPRHRCAGCDVLFGGLHHDGCSVAECPHCGGSLAACARNVRAHRIQL